MEPGHGSQLIRLAAAVLTAAAVLGPYSAAVAAQDCAGGVTVVVDFSAFGGGIDVGCADGPPSSGLAALSGAGFAPTMVQRQPAFVCRVDGLPADDPCVDTPPADAYWAYWHAASGGTWQYATTGAAVRAPGPGTVDGWVFTTSAEATPPGMAPPVSAPPPTTTTTVPATEAPTSTAAPTTTEAAPPPTVMTNPAPSTTTTRPPVATTTTTAPPPATITVTTAPETTTTAPITTSTAPVAAPVEQENGGRPGAGLVAGVIAVTGLAVLGAVVARRRRGAP